MMMSCLLCLVCGFEHGGTTMLSELLRQHPGVDGRFETGFLMGKRPSDFESTGPFPGFVRRGWGVDAAGMGELVRSRTFMEMYERLRELSNLPDKTVRIYDKTPAYMSSLSRVMRKVSVPVLVTVKDPRAIMWSVKRRRGNASASAIASHLNRYAAGYEAAKRLYGDRILLVRNEHLCTEPERYGREIFDFLGLEWDDSYVSLSDYCSVNSNVYGVSDGAPRGIVSDRLTEWRGNLSRSDEESLRVQTGQIRGWYWEG